MKNKKRKCPFCKGKKGFEIVIRLGGLETKHVDFTGKIIYTERVGSDTIEHYAHCLECKRLIDEELLDLSNV